MPDSLQIGAFIIKSMVDLCSVQEWSTPTPQLFREIGGFFLSEILLKFGLKVDKDFQSNDILGKDVNLSEDLVFNKNEL